MAQATTTPTAVPAKYGPAYAEVIGTAATLTADQVDDLDRRYRDAVDSLPAGIYDRVDIALELIRRVDEHHVLEPLAAVDAADAVLARDRGLITAADFDSLTEVWVAAGLPIPHAITADEAIFPFTPLNHLTSDAIGDWLLRSYYDTDEYGAVLALTGYNHGELLTYPGVRRCLDIHDSGVRLVVDWESLRGALHIADMEDDARDFLIFALVMSPGGTPAPALRPAPAGDTNAELAVRAVAYHLGVPDAVDPRWEPRAGHTPEAVPQPRDGWEPSA